MSPSCATARCWRRIASSLTEMFSPDHHRRAGLAACWRNYDFITADTLAYFTPRLTQAPQRCRFRARLREAHMPARRAEQEAVLAALRFKCDVLWSQLDALHFAYVEPGAASRPAPSCRQRCPGGARMTAAGDAVPRLRDAACKLPLRSVRDAWVRAGAGTAVRCRTRPAVEILKLVDGDAHASEPIIDDLAARFDAPRDVIAADVVAMLSDLADKGAVRL